MDYKLHDISEFPFVVLRPEACLPGFAGQWDEEMTALLAAGQPFVVAFDPEAINETAQDFKSRAQWFKRNRSRLAASCAGMVAIVASQSEREALHADLAKRSRGLGVTYLALASLADAGAATSRLLAQHAGAPLQSPLTSD